ncbi:MAG: hypothetical protein WCS69_00405 [Ignavibacteriaceae bacterium]|jgi:hypothetical protein
MSLKIIFRITLLSLFFTVAIFAQKINIETRLKALEKKVDSLEFLIKKNNISKDDRSNKPTNIGVSPSRDVQQSKNDLFTLESWSYSVTSDNISSYYAIKLKLKNDYEKGIKLIDATVQFYDLLDSRLFGIKIGPDIIIPAKQLVEENGSYSINQFINEENRMKTMNKEDVKAVLNVKKIVFDDNSIINLDK